MIAGDRSSITFFPCGTTSHNENDVKYLYCGRCHRFHSEEGAAA